MKRNDYLDGVAAGVLLMFFFEEHKEFLLGLITLWIFYSVGSWMVEIHREREKEDV